jgi:hypothetical protein
VTLLHLAVSEAISGASILSGIAGTALLYVFTDPQNAPQGWGSGPAMYARIRRRMPWVKTGYGLLFLSFLLQGVSLFLPVG